MNQYRQNEKDVPNCSGIGKLVSVLHRRAQAFYTRYLKEYDISLAEYPVLFMLSTHDGVTQDEIAWDQGDGQGSGGASHKVTGSQRNGDEAQGFF